MSKRTVVGILLVLIIFLIFGVTFFLVDFNLVVRNNDPKLSFRTNIYDEGNTREYIGLGYKIIRYNIGSDNSINKFGTWFLIYDQNLNVKEDDANMSNPNGTYDIVGEIISMEEKELSLNIKSNSNESRYDEAIVKINSNTIITKSQKQIYRKDLKVGNKVRVNFTGIVTKSIPPQAIASTIVVEE